MAPDYKSALVLTNSKHQGRNMDVLLLFDDFIVIYLFNYTREAPMFVVFFVTDRTAAQ